MAKDGLTLGTVGKMLGNNSIIMKKIIITIFLGIAIMYSPVFGASYCLAQSTAADDAMGQLKAAAGEKGAGLAAPKDPRLVVANSIRVILEFLGVIALVLVIYSGFLWMTAGGNEEKVTKAKTLLSQATIGLVIILSAYSITLMIVRIATGRWTDYSNYQYIEQGPGVECQDPNCPPPTYWP